MYAKLSKVIKFAERSSIVLSVTSMCMLFADYD